MEKEPFYKKIGLLILDEDGKRFMVCEKAKENVTDDYIMPGGQLMEESDIACLRSEIGEELGCSVDTPSLELIGEYRDVAAGRPDKEVMIRLYRGKIIGDPKPHSEIQRLHWIGVTDRTNPRISPIIRNKIIPDLIRRGIIT
ncbi:MAG: NUDIX domain-containing protein [Candidatus Moraniibacteriota bacterium]